MAREELEVLSKAAEDERRFRERRHAEAKAKALQRKYNGDESSNSTKVLVKQVGPWQEYFDKKRNKTFFYNKETKEKQWKLPVEIALSFSMSESEHFENDSDQEQNESGDDTQADIKQEYNEEDNSNPSPKPEEHLGNGESEPKRIELNEVVDENSNEETKQSESNQKDGEWEQVYDPSSGNYYYYNSNTQETTWTMPESFAFQKKNEVNIFSADNQLSVTTHVREQEQSTNHKEFVSSNVNQEIESSQEKVATVDSSNNNTNSNNNNNASDSNGKSNAESAADQAKKKKKKKPAGQVINGWEKHVHSSSGKEFYVNINTGEKTWKKPPEYDLSKIVEDTANQPVPDQQQAATIAETQDQEKQVKSFWVEAKTDDGKVYYYNTETFATSWELPPKGTLMKDEKGSE